MKMKSNKTNSMICIITILSILIGLNVVTVEAEKYSYKLGSSGSGDGQFSYPESVTSDVTTDIITDVQIGKYANLHEDTVPWSINPQNTLFYLDDVMADANYFSVLINFANLTHGGMVKFYWYGPDNKIISERYFDNITDPKLDGYDYWIWDSVNSCITSLCKEDKPTISKAGHYYVIITSPWGNKRADFDVVDRATTQTVSITADPDTHNTTIGTSFTFVANPVGLWGNNIQYNWSIANDKTNSKCPKDWKGVGKSISASAACIGTHNISVVVSDEKGNVASSSYLMTVVLQKVELLIVPTYYREKGYGVTSSNLGELSDIADKVKNFYLKSSYGSVYLNFSIYSNITNLAGYSNHADIRKDAIGQIDAVNPGYLDNYEIIVVVDEIKGQLEGHELGQTGGTSEYGFRFPVSSVPIAVNDSEYISKNIRPNDYRVGIWAHEIGHALYSVLYTSEANSNLLSKYYRSLPDMYGDGYSVYFWSLMGLGSLVVKGEHDLSNKPSDMSSLSKIGLGFLKRSEVGYGSYSISSVENAHLNDSALIFKGAYIPGLYSVEYSIETREIEPSAICYNNKNCSNLENGVLIYKREWSLDLSKKPLENVSVNILRRNMSNWTDPSFFAKDGTSAGYYEDCARFVSFSVSSSHPSHPYSSEIKISEPGSKCKILKGIMLIIGPVSWIPTSFFYSADAISTSPDLDLHAYTPDGKHVGMNYTNGEYEMQIPGTMASGDLVGGEEWIFVPTGTQVEYSVDSHNVKKFLEENPGINVTNATMDYSAISIEYGENPQRTQLPDGNWTVSNRTISAPKKDTIEPGTKKAVQVDKVSQDMAAYYRGLGQYPDIVETNDLLKAADDWRSDIIPQGFSVSITTSQLLTLADEWRSS